MEAGDIIYFIIAIIVFFGSLINKENKKHVKQMKDDMDTVPPDVAEVPRNKMPPPLSKVKKVAKKKRSKEYETIDFESSVDNSRMFAYEGTSAIPNELYTINEAEELDALHTNVYHPLITDLKKGNLQHEIRKGFVYSEILNRKY